MYKTYIYTIYIIYIIIIYIICACQIEINLRNQFTAFFFRKDYYFLLLINFHFILNLCYLLNFLCEAGVIGIINVLEILFQYPHLPKFLNRVPFFLPLFSYLYPCYHCVYPV